MTVSLSVVSHFAHSNSFPRVKNIFLEVRFAEIVKNISMKETGEGSRSNYIITRVLLTYFTKTYNIFHEYYKSLQNIVDN